MAFEQGAQATGTVQDGQNLRRRNVPDHSGSNGTLTQASPEPDNKKSQKVYQASKVSLLHTDTV